MDTSRCEADGDYFTSGRYSCNGYNETNTVELWAFSDATIPATTEFWFTIGDAIVNPSTLDRPGTITAKTVLANGDSIDTGSYDCDDCFPDAYFNTSLIETFEVTPLDLGVGMYPVTYRFRVVPGGDLPVGAYFEIALPETIKINDESLIERTCGGTYRVELLAFTNSYINCQVNGGNLISVKDGFKHYATANYSDPLVDNHYEPPEFYFDLPQFINPRETTDSAPFNITIFNADKEKIYIWNTTDAPVVRMSGAATPGVFFFERESPANGNITWYEFQVQTTNYLVGGDKIYLELPYPAYFSEDTACSGRTANLDNV